MGPKWRLFPRDQAVWQRALLTGFTSDPGYQAGTVGCDLGEAVPPPRGVHRGAVRMAAWKQTPAFGRVGYFTLTARCPRSVANDAADSSVVEGAKMYV